MCRIVAPFAGAWIEIRDQGGDVIALVSHPSRVRGLKYIRVEGEKEESKSHPSRVRGLK